MEELTCKMKFLPLTASFPRANARSHFCRKFLFLLTAQCDFLALGSSSIGAVRNCCQLRERIISSMVHKVLPFALVFVCLLSLLAINEKYHDTFLLVGVAHRSPPMKGRGLCCLPVAIAMRKA